MYLYQAEIHKGYTCIHNNFIYISTVHVFTWSKMADDFQTQKLIIITKTRPVNGVGIVME